jgi:WD40 repeat protein
MFNPNEPMPTTGSPPNTKQTVPSWQELPEIPVQIPDHELLRRVGCGSYGEVWLARNRMGTLRAVKIVHRKKFKDNVPFERELAGIRRFEPISRSHEGFMDVLHVGINEAEGYFYYVMELGDDRLRGPEIDPATYAPKTLASEIALHGHGSPEQCLQWGIALSSALHQLHQHGLVHRDVKPSNIIFVSGVPKLADIGLVAELREARSFVGTEGFIPPEGPGRAQADIYGLGKVLYEALTGRDRLDFPSLPKDFEQLADKELFWEVNSVILHACQNEAADRYRKAWDMHTDLLFLTSGKSVKRLKELERLIRKGKRIAVAALPFVLIAGAVSFQITREIRHRSELRQRDVGMDLAYGNRSMASGDLLGSLPYFVNALAVDKGDSQQEDNHRFRIGSILAQCPKLTHLWVEPKQLESCDFSPDRRRFVVAQNFGRARVYSLEANSPVGAPFGPPGLLQVSYSPDGKYIATAGADRTSRVWDAETLSEISRLTHPGTVFSARFSPDGTQLLTSCGDRIARVWNWSTRETNRALRGHQDALRFAAFSPNGKLIITASQDNTARIWDAKSGQCLRTLPHAMWVCHAAFSPDGRRIITACDDHKARVWDVESGTRILPDLEHRDVVACAEFSPDNRLVLTATFDGTVQLWSGDTLRPLWSNPLLRFPDRVQHATFSSDSRQVGVVCIDGSIWTWDLAGAAVPACTNRCYFSGDSTRSAMVVTNLLLTSDQNSGHTTATELPAGIEIEKPGFNSDGSIVFTIALTKEQPNKTNRLVTLRKFSTGETTGPSVTFTSDFRGVAVNRDGTRVVSWGTNTAAIWDVLAGRCSQLGFVNNGQVAGCFFAPAKGRLVVLSGNTARICDEQTGEPVLPPLIHEHPVRWAVFSPDGLRLLICSQDDLMNKCYAQIWDVETGEPIGKRLGHGDGVLYGAFSPDGRRVITASEDFTAIVWDAQTGDQITSVLEHDNQVPKSVFAPGGKRVATASTDTTARVWDAQSGAPLTPYLPHIIPLQDVRFWEGHLITSGRTNSWIWTLENDTRPAEDLSRLARMLTAGTVTPSGRLRRFSSESFLSDWETLRKRYSSNFTVSPAQVLAWHQHQAEDAEEKKCWFTAAFHLERLIALQGANPDLLRRRDFIRSHSNDVP